QERAILGANFLLQAHPFRGKPEQLAHRLQRHRPLSITSRAWVARPDDADPKPCLLAQPLPPSAQSTFFGAQIGTRPRDRRLGGFERQWPALPPIPGGAIRTAPPPSHDFCLQR